MCIPRKKQYVGQYLHLLLIHARENFKLKRCFVFISIYSASASIYTCIFRKNEFSKGIIHLKNNIAENFFDKFELLLLIFEISNHTFYLDELEQYIAISNNIKQ